MNIEQQIVRAIQELEREQCALTGMPGGKGRIEQASRVWRLKLEVRSLKQQQNYNNMKRGIL